MTLYDHDLERAILSGIADASAIDVQRGRTLADEARLTASDFHLPLHADVWTVALGLFRDNAPVDLLTVAARLPKADRKALTDALMVTVPSTETTLMAHAEAIRELAVRRKALAVCEAVRAAALNREKPIDAVLSAGASGWADLSKVSATTKSGQEVFMSTIDQLEAASRGEQVRCIKTGIDVWDQILGGVSIGELTFIGSQPGVGKSSLIGTMVANLCDREVPTALLSLEDPAEWLPMRLMARAAAVPLFVLEKCPETLTAPQKKRIEETSKSVYDSLAALRVDDRSLLTAEQVCQSARAMVLQYGCRVVFIDHLGKIAHDYKGFDRPDLAIAHTLTHLSALAKDMKVAVVVAAHMKGRETDERFKRPEPTDFAGAAAIERDARAAVGLYLDKEDPDALLVAMLKQTKGKSNDTFAIGRLKEAGLVKSRNGKLAVSYEADERTLLAARNEHWSNA